MTFSEGHTKLIELNKEAIRLRNDGKLLEADRKMYQFYKLKIELHKSINSIVPDTKQKTYFELEREYLNKQSLKVFLTEVSEIDNNMGGLTEGSFINFAGESGAGKSTTVIRILKNIAKYTKVMFFNLEMSEPITNEKLKKLNWQDNTHKDNFILHSENSLLGIENVIISNPDIRFFAIDSRMKIKTETKDKYEKSSEISSVLSQLCIKHSIVIMLINQMSKQDSKQNILELKDSGDVTYDSDVIFFMRKHKNYPDVKVRKLFCSKNRHGKTFAVEMGLEDENIMELDF
jgi:replicative DNA helicase